MPLHLMESRLLRAYPLVPLFENQALGVALFSYDGQLCWGFNADWDLVPDLRDFVSAISESFGELHDAAESAAGKASASHRFANAMETATPESRIAGRGERSRE